MVERIAERFEKAMKKGFISTLTLLVLEKEPLHGRQIKKAIEERTFGVWEPPDSTMYTVLKDLREKNLIKQSEQQSEDDKTIIYELTEKGKETLDIMLKKEQEIRESMRSIITSTFGISDELMDTSEKSFPGFPSPFSRFIDKPKKETPQILYFQREFVKKRIEMLKEKLQNIEKKISKLENENQN